MSKNENGLNAFKNENISPEQIESSFNPDPVDFNPGPVEEAKKDPGAAMVPVNDQKQAAALFGSGADKLQAQWCSIPNDGSREAAIKIFNAFGDAESLSDYVGQAIEVQDVAAHTVTVGTEKGEAVDTVRCVLITPKGERYACVADGVKDSLTKMFGIVGLPPWNPAVKLAAKNVKTRNGYRTLRIELIGE